MAQYQLLREEKRNRWAKVKNDPPPIDPPTEAEVSWPVAPAIGGGENLRLRSNHGWGDADQYLLVLDGTKAGLYERLEDGAVVNRCDLGLIKGIGPYFISQFLHQNIFCMRQLLVHLLDHNTPAQWLKNVLKNQRARQLVGNLRPIPTGEDEGEWRAYAARDTNIRAYQGVLQALREGENYVGYRQLTPEQRARLGFEAVMDTPDYDALLATLDAARPQACTGSAGLEVAYPPNAYDEDMGFQRQLVPAAQAKDVRCAAHAIPRNGGANADLLPAPPRHPRRIPLFKPDARCAAANRAVRQVVAEVLRVLQVPAQRGVEEEEEGEREEDEDDDDDAPRPPRVPKRRKTRSRPRPHPTRRPTRIQPSRRTKSREPVIPPP